MEENRETYEYENNDGAEVIQMPSVNDSADYEVGDLDDSSEESGNGLVTAGVIIGATAVAVAAWEFLVKPGCKKLGSLARKAVKKIADNVKEEESTKAAPKKEEAPVVVDGESKEVSEEPEEAPEEKAK